MSGPLNSRWSLAAVLLGFLLVLALFRVQGNGSDPVPRPMDEVMAAPVLPDAPPSLIGLREAKLFTPGTSESAPVRTVRDALLEHWGQEWPSVEARLLEQGRDLDRVAERIPAWDEVAPEIEKHFAYSEAKIKGLRDRFLWTFPTTAEVVADKLSRTLVDLVAGECSAIDEIAYKYQDDLSASVDDYIRLMNDALGELWRQRRFEKSPYTLAGVGAPGRERLIMSTSLAVNGWCVGLRVLASEFPELDSVRKRLEELKHERNHEVSAFLDRR